MPNRVMTAGLSETALIESSRRISPGSSRAPASCSPFACRLPREGTACTAGMADWRHPSPSTGQPAQRKRPAKVSSRWVCESRDIQQRGPAWNSRDDCSRRVAHHPHREAASTRLGTHRSGCVFQDMWRQMSGRSPHHRLRGGGSVISRRKGAIEAVRLWHHIQACCAR